MGLARLVLHNICIERSDIIPNDMDLGIDKITEIANFLELADRNQKIYNTSSSAMKLYHTITGYFW